MTKTFSGGCSCGEVRYTCDAEPLATIICHCNDCQHATGGPFGVVLFVPRDALSLQGELGSQEVTGNTGNQVKRKYCRACGSPIIGETQSLPKWFGISVGSLDDSSWVQPQAHCWVSRKQSWVVINDGLPQFAEAPRF